MFHLRYHRSWMHDVYNTCGVQNKFGVKYKNAFNRINTSTVNNTSKQHHVGLRGDTSCLFFSTIQMFVHKCHQ